MNQKNIEIPKDKIASFSKKWNISEFSLFGSVLQENYHPDSDIDILVAFGTDASWSLLDHVEMQDELKEVFGRKVDLVSRKGIEHSRNYIRRKSILESAEAIYVSP